MKVNIGPYVNRWTCQIHYDYMNKKYNYQWEKNTTKFEALLERVEDVTQWIYNHTVNLYLDNKKVNRKVKIHAYDTWNMDGTLAYIIHPMLKQLKETKHGSPMVDLEDVPKEMRTTSTEDYDPQKTFEFYNDPEICKQNNKCDIHDRWDWVMNEMIWAFEQKTRDHWEKDYYGPYIEGEDGKILSGHFEWVDDEGRYKHQKRMSNGFRLFGKYYEGLWD